MRLLFHTYSTMLRYFYICAIFALASGQLQRVHLKKNPNHFITVGNIRAERNYMMSKHNVQVNVNSTECIVSFDNYIKHLFTGEIAIGTPPQKLTVLFSTDASTVFVTTCLYRKECPAGVYNANASTSAFHSTYRDYYIGYVDSIEDGGIFNGKFGEDTVEVAGMKLFNVPLVEMPSTEQFFSVNVIFGLGVVRTRPNQDADQYGYYGPVYSMYQQGYIQNAVYSLYYSKDGGQVMFGGSDPSLYQGKLAYFDLDTNTNGDIYLQPSSIKINNIELITNYDYAIIDSAFSLIACPLYAFVKINQQLGGIVDQEGHYFVECSKVDTLPNIDIYLNETVFTLTPQAYILNVTGPDALTPCMAAFTYINLEEWVLGLPFLNQFYTEYDILNKKFGIAIPV